MPCYAMGVIELLIGAGVVALGIVAVRALRQTQRPGEETPKASTTADKADEEARPGSVPPPSSPARKGPRGLRVGDVLLYAGSEMWLAGEVYLHEEGFALSVFPTPGGRTSWVVQLDAEGREIAFLSETTEVPDGSVPTELPVGGMRLSLRRKGHASVTSEGEHLPLTTEKATYAVLGGPGGRTLVIVDFEAGDRLALVGERLAREMYDLLPGSDE